MAAPHNNLSKALSVTYAMCGIPIYAVYLSYAYLVISFTLDRAALVLFKCVGYVCTSGRVLSCLFEKEGVSNEHKIYKIDWFAGVSDPTA